MTKLAIASLLLASSALSAMADMGGGGDGEAFYIVHAQEAEGTITLDANGRITTALNERPEWAHGLAVAMLHERKSFYETRLGATGAKDHLAMNTLNVEDLCWVAFDEAGDEVEVEPLPNFRMEILATALGVDGEGEIHGAIAERTIAQDTKSWDETAAVQDENAKTGTQG